MKEATKKLLERAEKLAHLIGTTLETNVSNDTITSADCLDLDVAIADLRQLVNDAHHSEYGL